MNTMYVKKQFFLCSWPVRVAFWFIILFSSSLYAIADWTLLVYAQANNSLAPFALKNFSDMAQIGSSDRVNALVQWYQASQPGIWRYKIEKGKMVLDECNGQNTDGCGAAELVDSMRWAVKKYPAKRYALVLWDHGLGILDPAWKKTQSFGKDRQDFFVFDQALVRQHPRIQIDGLTIDGEVTFSKSVESFAPEGSGRSILFNEHTRTYMDSKGLALALNTIKTSVLGNRKIDLLGMDACLMAMVEIGYLARNSAQYLVASQEIELAYGWNYLTLLSLFAAASNEPCKVAQSIVEAYGAYYQDKTQFFTQSAVNLENIDPLKNAINAVVAGVRECKAQGDRGAVNLIAKQARYNCLQLSPSHYVDLHSFLSEFTKGLNGIQIQGWKLASALQQLKNTIAMCQHVIEQTVIANNAGKCLARAKGLSIYFPLGRVDASYLTTAFAQESLWLGFIQEL